MLKIGTKNQVHMQDLITLTHKRPYILACFIVTIFTTSLKLFTLTVIAPNSRFVDLHRVWIFRIFSKLTPLYIYRTQNTLPIQQDILA